MDYVSTYPGIKKLIEAEPLTKLVPVDLYIPIMYDEYGDDQVNRHFPTRNLVALAIRHPLTFPSKYHVDKDHITDTGKLV